MDRTLAVDGSVGRARFVTARRLVNERGVLIGLVIVALAFGAMIGPQFFAGANLELMARQTVIVCVAALGMTMVIVSGGPERTAPHAGRPFQGRQKSVLLVSSYLPELLGVCDRIAVMSRGRLGAARPVEAWTEHSLLMEASGARAAS